jgi:signal peptidase I
VAERTHTRIDKKVRKESKALVKEVRRALRRYGYKIPKGVAERLQLSADTLDKAYQDDDGDAMRLTLVELDDLADEHLSFARKSTLREYAESIGFAVLIALFLRAFVVEAFKIPSGSMIPTMEIGDHIFVNKFIYGIRIPYTRTKFFQFRKPRRGEVIVFINPCQPEKDFIKRIVALEGDTVEVRCSMLYVNDKLVPAEHAKGVCRHWDYDEATREWAAKECSHYNERVDGRSYATIHSPDRPDDEATREPTAPYSAVAGEHDFPVLRLPNPRDETLPPTVAVTKQGVTTTYVRPDIPTCGEPDPRSPEQRAKSRGRYELSHSKLTGPCSPQFHYIVPKGHVFVMGDNRRNSSDSRVWGVVPLENIKGKALFIWWSSKPAKAGGIAWRRLGKVVH